LQLYVLVCDLEVVNLNISNYRIGMWVSNPS